MTTENTATNTTGYPELTPDQREYVAGWSDPVEARRRRIEALTTICEGLFPAIYTAGLVDDPSNDVLDDALRAAKCQLLRELAVAGALNGAVVYSECGNPRDTVWSLSTEVPGILLLNDDSISLTDFVDNMIETYVGLPDTRAYGEAATAELARHWLAQQLTPEAA